MLKLCGRNKNPSEARTPLVRACVRTNSICKAPSPDTIDTYDLLNELYHQVWKSKDENNKYTNSDASEKLIRYVTRTNGQPDDDLLAWGGLSVLEYGGIARSIKQFYIAEAAHTRNGDFGKYMNHEIFFLFPRG